MTRRRRRMPDRHCQCTYRRAALVALGSFTMPTSGTGGRKKAKQKKDAPPADGARTLVIMDVPPQRELHAVRVEKGLKRRLESVGEV